MEQEVIFPIGVSHGPYWRALTQDSSEWRDDLLRMKELGMTMVSVFASWHRIEKEEGVYDFTDLDLIFDLAQEIGLKVTIGLGVHIGYSIYPPRWIIRKYNKGCMVDANGNTDVDGTYKQPCFEEEEYRSYAERYFKALAKRYGKHPALIQWRTWGEATIHPYCWCDTHKRMFREFLQEKYGTIEELNTKWGSEGPSDFISFDEIHPPRRQYRFHSYREIIDWCDFLDQSLTATVARVGDWIKSEDPVHPTLGEFWLPEANSSTGGDDIWHLIRYADQVGLSIYNKPPARCAKDMDLMASAARIHNKEAWVLEVQGGTRVYSAGWDEPYAPSGDQAVLWMWQFIAHGAKGICYWTWRPRVSDLEGGEFGIARRDGTLTDRSMAMQGDFNLVQKLAPWLLPGQRKAEVVIGFFRDAEHLASMDRIDRADISYYMGSILSAHEMLWRAGYPADFLGEWKIEHLRKYKVLLLPFSFSLSRENAAVIRQFVEEGGTVIADYQLASKDDRGYCDSVVPGFGLSEVFGIADDDILNGTGESFVMNDGTDIDIFRYVMTCRLRGAEAVGSYQGYPSCTRHKFGKGTAYFIGTVFFHRESWSGHENNTQYLYKLLGEAGVHQPVNFQSNDGSDANMPELVMQDTKDNCRLVFLINHSTEAVAGTITLRDGASVSAVEDLRTGEAVPFTKENGAAVFAGQTGKKQCGIYLIR